MVFNSSKVAETSYARFVESPDADDNRISEPVEDTGKPVETPVETPPSNGWNWVGFVKTSVLSMVIAGMLALISELVVLPYFVLSPGAATPVGKFVDIPADHRFKPAGEVMFTTVSVAQAHPLDILWAWLDPHSRIERKEDLIGKATPQQYSEANQVSMEESKMTATYQAMHRAGFNVAYRGDGAEVVGVSDNSPASGHLQADDVVVAIDGARVERAEEVGAKIRPVKPGTVVKLQVKNKDGVERSEELTTAPRPDDANLSYVGIRLQTKNPHLDTPFPLELKTQRIGGPSAGLAFTLAGLDELTKGELTGGKKVAVTGTMELDGSVGAVGGIEQKSQAVSDSGAKLFLVPEAEVRDAKKSVSKGVKVVGVSDLESALRALKDNGGDVSGVPNS